MITYFGIKTCDTVKRATTALAAASIPATFHDFRKDGLDQSTAEAFIAALGAETVINKRGTTWRGLSDADKARADSDAAALIMDYPALIKRPVWQKGGDYRVGFAKKDEADMLGWLQA